MRFIYPAAAFVLLASPAFAQSAPQMQQPSQAAIIGALHQQLIGESDELTLAKASLYDAQQQVVALQSQLDAAKKSPPKPAGK